MSHPSENKPDLFLLLDRMGRKSTARMVVAAAEEKAREKAEELRRTMIEERRKAGDMDAE